MPELNPYEPPQVQSKPTASDMPRETATASLMLDWIVPSLLSLQIIAGVLAWVFDFMQAMAHSGYQRLQAMAEFFGISFFVLGVILFLIAVVGRYVKVFVFEIFAILFILWLSLPVIH